MSNPEADKLDKLYQKAMVATGSSAERGPKKILRCEMKRDCEQPVTYVDHKGYIYCTQHGQARKAHGINSRKLSPGEIKKLEQGQTIRYR